MKAEQTAPGPQSPTSLPAQRTPSSFSPQLLLPGHFWGLPWILSPQNSNHRLCQPGPPLGLYLGLGLVPMVTQAPPPAECSSQEWASTFPGHPLLWFLVTLKYSGLAQKALQGRAAGPNSILLGHSWVTIPLPLTWVQTTGLQLQWNLKSDGNSRGQRVVSTPPQQVVSVGGMELRSYFYSEHSLP